MLRKPDNSRWSTLTLLGVSVSLGALGYLAGLSARTIGHPAVSARAPGLPAVAAGAGRESAVREKSGARWLALASAPRTPEWEKNMIAALQALAAEDHARALGLALAEPNWRLRALLRNAVLTGWASITPADAAQFALTLPNQERRDAVAALLVGASNSPEAAAEVTMTVCARDPALAEDYGRALIDALAPEGAFEVLIRFAGADPSGHSPEWLRAAFGRWAERQPEAARQALESLPNPAARQAAFQGMVLGWSAANPTELATYALGLPAGENRTFAMQQALSQWMTHDPDSVAAWVLRFDPGPEFDLTAAAVATTPKLTMQQPAVALGWAQSITDPALREMTLTSLAHQWALVDRARAKGLIEQTQGLFPQDRRVLLSGLDYLPPEL